MFHDAVSRKIKEHCLFSFYCLTERKDKESENDVVWKFGQSEDLYWGVSASKEFGEELQQILADAPAVATHVLWKLLKKMEIWWQSKWLSNWDLEVYFDTSFKSTVEECMQWQLFKGEQTNKKKAIWTVFCIY